MRAGRGWRTRRAWRHRCRAAHGVPRLPRCLLRRAALGNEPRLAATPGSRAWTAASTWPRSTSMCGLHRRHHLLCDPGLVGAPLLRPGARPSVRRMDRRRGPTARTHGHTSCSSRRAAPASREASRSPSTRLTPTCASMYDCLPPLDGAVVCSWFPLSHDMGLIGLALYAICSVNPPWSTPTDLVLMTPEVVPGRSRPSGCGPARDYRATSTTAPPFALRLAARSLRSSSVDLSSLRSFVVGSEPVPAEVASASSTGRLGRFGLSPTALCPGYGMAEATLAVRHRSHDTSPWSSVRVDPDSLAAGEWRETGEGGDRSRLVRTARARHRGPGHWRTTRSVNSRSAARHCSAGTSAARHRRSRTTAGSTPPTSGRYTAGRSSWSGAPTTCSCRRAATSTRGRSTPRRRPIRRAGPGNVACILTGGVATSCGRAPSGRDGGGRSATGRAGDPCCSWPVGSPPRPRPSSSSSAGRCPKTPSGKVRRNHLRALWADGKLRQLHPGDRIVS